MNKKTVGSKDAADKFVKNIVGYDAAVTKAQIESILVEQKDTAAPI